MGCRGATSTTALRSRSPANSLCSCARFTVTIPAGTSRALGSRFAFISSNTASCVMPGGHGHGAPHNRGLTADRHGDLQPAFDQRIEAVLVNVVRRRLFRLRIEDRVVRSEIGLPYFAQIGVGVAERGRLRWRAMRTTARSLSFRP